MATAPYCDVQHRETSLSGAVRPTLSRTSTIPASAPRVPPDVRLNGERVPGGGVTMQPVDK
jgi:hypothetical protein